MNAVEPAPNAVTGSVLNGVFSVVPTPFDPSGAIDYSGLKRAVRFFVETGVDGLTALGVTSETSRLSDQERAGVLECIFAEVGGRLPIVVGATTDGLSTTIELCERARSLGAAAVMVGPPRMARGTSDAVMRYFSSLAKAADIDIVLQDYPAVSGFSLEVSLLVRLAEDIPHIRAIKLEDPPTGPKIAALRDAGLRSLDIFGGLGGAFLLEELLAGSTGAMTGFAFPEVLIHIVRTYRAGDHAGAADTFYQYTPVLRFEAQEGIGMAIRKEFLRRRGVIDRADLRQPGPGLDRATLNALDHVLEWSRLDDVDAEVHPWN